MAIDEIGVFEVNEAFAPVPPAWRADLGANEKTQRGPIALGHLSGALRARIVTTMLHHARNKRLRYGLWAVCGGGGQANATTLELL